MTDLFLGSLTLKRESEVKREGRLDLASEHLKSDFNSIVAFRTTWTHSGFSP